MTNPVDDEYVKSALRKGETLSTEFKSSVLMAPPGQTWSEGTRRNKEREFIKDVGALANVVEGPNTPVLIIIGVDRIGNPSPDGPLHDRAAMDRLAREEFEHPIELRYTEHHVEMPGGTQTKVVVSQIFADAENRPYRVRSTASHEHAGKAFGRRFKVGKMPLEPEVYILNSEECSRLQESAAIAREPTAWPLSDVSDDDLVPDQVDVVLSANSIPTDRSNPDHRRRRMQRCGLLTPGGRPTYVAALFCCEPPLPSSLPGAEILLVVHSPGSEQPVPRRFHGILPDQIRAAFEAFKRETGPKAPDEAVREILVNATIHRDYRRAEPVRVDLYPDRCVIESPGGLIPPITVEHLTGPRFFDRQPPHRNAVLVRTFLAVQRSYFTDSAFEGIGSGIPEAYAVAKRLGADPPLSAFADDWSVVVTVHGRFMASGPPFRAGDSLRGDLLGYLRQYGPARFAELAAAFGRTPPNRIRQALRELRQTGQIRQTSGGRFVKYEVG